ncbi:MAG TPA: rhomboid family intramembrane serine protease [Terriglobales bacterium]
MRRTPMSLSFPPFTRAIKILIAINTAVYLLLLILSATGHGSAAADFNDAFALQANDVIHGRVYQLLTYGFVHQGFFHLLFNMLMLWMFGSMLESRLGSRKFWEFYLFGVVGAGLTSVVLAYTLGGIVHLGPMTRTVGSSGGIYAIFMASAMLFGDVEVFLFPLPFAIKLKYLVTILALIALVGALGDLGGTANVAHLGGLLFGYLFIKFVPRRGLTLVFSEGYFGVRNYYHRLKRERAKKKFQVYMRKHDQDPKQYFDEYGNFRPPDEEKDKKDRGPGGWVN